MKERLSKVLARAGIASRRACEELIFEGRVRVNGQKVVIPQTLVSLTEDTILVDDQKVSQEEEKIAYAVHKPAGYLCTSAPVGNRKRRVIDILDGHDPRRLYTVGRLDQDTSGLIIVTNDGFFANTLMHPRSEIEKEYLVKVNKEITHDHLVEISQGGFVEGKFVKPKSVTKVRKGTFKIVVTDGRKHEVRTLVDKVGLDIYSLERIRIGNLILGGLPVGSYKKLTERDKKLLLQQ